MSKSTRPAVDTEKRFQNQGIKLKIGIHGFFHCWHNNLKKIYINSYLLEGPTTIVLRFLRGSLDGAQVPTTLRSVASYRQLLARFPNLCKVILDTYTYALDMLVIRCYTNRRINCNYLRANAGLSGSFANSQRWVSDARKITYPRAFTNAIPTSWNHGKVGLKWININIKLSAALVIINVINCSWLSWFIPSLDQILRYQCW